MPQFIEMIFYVSILYLVQNKTKATKLSQPQSINSVMFLLSTVIKANYQLMLELFVFWGDFITTVGHYLKDKIKTGLG